MRLTPGSLAILTAENRRIWGVGELQDVPEMHRAVSHWKARDRTLIRQMLASGRARVMACGLSACVLAVEGDSVHVEIGEGEGRHRDRSWIPAMFLTPSHPAAGESWGTPQPGGGG